MNRLLNTFCISIWCGMAGAFITQMRFNPQHFGKKLDGYIIKFMPVTGLYMCIYECMVTAKCLSINYYQEDSWCELNSDNSMTASEHLVQHAGRVLYIEINGWPTVIAKNCQGVQCPLGHRCSSAPPGYTCVRDECDNPPQVLNAALTPESTIRSFKGSVSYECQNGLILRGSSPTLACQIGFRWSKVKFRCALPGTCSEISQCSGNSYTEDTEYWLYPAILNPYEDDTKVKVYCSGMASTNPKEYITLTGTNNARYNGREAVHYWEMNCDIRTYGTIITTNFQKIRLDIEKMRIINTDHTFSSTSGGSAMNYGTGGDCTYAHGCLPRQGYFHIDTTNTGLVVDPTLEWKGNGWNPKLHNFARTDGNRKITIRCGGKCGGCEPDGDMLIEINPNEVLEESVATMPVCG